MATEKLLVSTELSRALGLASGVPVTPKELERKLKQHKAKWKLSAAALIRMVAKHSKPMVCAGQRWSYVAPGYPRTWLRVVGVANGMVQYQWCGTGATSTMTVDHLYGHGKLK